jgi:hypothetical protein
MSRVCLVLTEQAPIEQFRRTQGTSSTFDTLPTTNCSQLLRLQSFLLELPFSSVLFTSFLILLYFLSSRSLFLLEKFTTASSPSPETRSISVTGLDSFDDSPRACLPSCRDFIDLCTPSARLQPHSRYPSSLVLEVDNCLPHPSYQQAQWRPMAASLSRINTRVLLSSTQLPPVLLSPAPGALQAMTCRRTRWDGISSNSTIPH